MNKEDIIRMARKAGFEIDEASRQYQPKCISFTHYLIDDELSRFAALVAAAEREIRTDALALLGTIHMGNESKRSQDIIRAAVRTLQKNAPEELAAAIRARGQE